jgi:hypothetical protein
MYSLYNLRCYCQKPLLSLLPAAVTNFVARSNTKTAFILQASLWLTAAAAAATAASIGSASVLWYMLVYRPNSSFNRAVLDCYNIYIKYNEVRIMQ